MNMAKKDWHSKWASQEFVELGEALEIVYELARRNLRVDTDGKQQAALNTVHDFIVNNFEEE